LVTYFFLKETLKTPISLSEYLGFKERKDVGARRDVANSTSKSDKPLPVSTHALLKNRRIIIAVASYAVAAFLDITFRVIQPIFFATPIALGGLGLPPRVIGNILATFGIINGLFQVFFFAKIHDTWLSKKTYVVGIICLFPAFACFPAMSLLAQKQGLIPAVWVLVAIQLLSFTGLSLSFGQSLLFSCI
jgi:hypothetical protein